MLGIDPGTGILGFGVIDFPDRANVSARKNPPKIVDGGVIATPKNTSLSVRLVEIFDGLTEVIEATKPEVVSIEKLFFTKNVTTAISVAEARGVAILAAAQHGIPVAEYTPNEIKKTLTGYGSADKKQVQEMVRVELKLAEIPRPDDAADALAAAITHWFMTKNFQ